MKKLEIDNTKPTFVTSINFFINKISQKRNRFVVLQLLFGFSLPSLAFLAIQASELSFSRSNHISVPYVSKLKANFKVKENDLVHLYSLNRRYLYDISKISHHSLLLTVQNEICTRLKYRSLFHRFTIYNFPSLGKK